MTSTHDFDLALQRSLAYDETVTVTIDASFEEALAELHASELCEDYDHTTLTPTQLDVWGTNPHGNTWRLRLVQETR